MKVALFVTCLADVFFPDVGKSVVQVLESQGVEVVFPPDQTCCGQVTFNSGYWEDSKKSAKHFIEVFENEEYIIAPSGSCASMIRLHYPKLFEDEPNWKKRAEQVAERVYEFSEFLVHVLGLEQLQASFPAKATYHQSCHMGRGLGLINEPLQVLSKVEGLQIEPLPNQEDCCGFGGTFSVKMPEISVAMASEKIKHINESGADLVITSDLGCLMHIGGFAKRQGNGIRMLHVAEVLANQKG
ncbi:(Fe-S)-binding protein [Effusibacillus dendaii]|uniref:Lactate utilization protein A n=1 Tax=Effusibacillus dendaii TaxID=2743772 RepID=A0A7I8D5Y1_9BACL|nr:(Fe-S)-binding protein [Effusibacillus dendaii]BCJ85495.1 lactate utilization protein A [Effusibacillus dendaii]